ncbi:T9SS type A sorting domain-containing protein [Flavobacterium sp.]|uniref:T9SS type A sorting domain-containing protein n=1 Tax=Flavobacterium sp. TaxID=239 RepID=UPI0039E3486E
MKNIYLTVGAVLASLIAYAQPVINPSNVTDNLVCEALTATADNFSPGTAGADKVWDFSGLVLTPAGTNNIIPPDNTLFAAFFPSATVCMAYTGTTDAYLYYKHDSHKMELIGEGFSWLGTINYSGNPKTYIEFPYYYNRITNDSYRGNFDDAATVFTSVYDAYGKLILPFGTYDNVIRQKITENGQTDYIWFNVDPFFPIIQTALANNTMGIMKNAGALSASSFEKSLFSISPNPTHGEFAVNLPQFPGAKIDVYDANGKWVATHKVTEQSTKIDIDDCSSGVYLVKVTTKDGQSSTQKIVKK